MHIGSEQLKIFLSYDPDTGLFRWRSKTGRGTRIGGIAGCVTQGFVSIKICGQAYRAHRLAFLYVNEEEPCEKIIHLDGIRTNNRWDNLHEGALPGMSGVRRAHTGSRWHAYIGIGSKVMWLGTFDTKDEAIAARVIAEQRRESANKRDRLKQAGISRKECLFV